MNLQKSPDWRFWTGLGLFLTLVFWISDRIAGLPANWPIFTYGLLCAYLWAALRPLIRSLSRRFPIGERGPASLCFHLVASLIFALIIVLAFSLFFYQMQHWLGRSIALRRSVAVCSNYFFFADVVFYWVVIAADQAQHYFLKFRAGELRTAEMEKRVVSAQLHNLRAQLQPHFLFNTMHGIAALIRTAQHRQALDTLLMLSKLLRLTLDFGRKPQHLLRDELAFIKLYLAIAERRFGDRMKLQISVEPDAEYVVVPAQMLQPLVENSVRHGIEADPDAGLIRLTVRRGDFGLNILLENDGPSLADDWREGVGIAHTRAQLAYFYPNRHRFTLENRSGGGVRVLLELPLAGGEPALLAAVS